MVTTRIARNPRADWKDRWVLGRRWFVWVYVDGDLHGLRSCWTRRGAEWLAYRLERPVL